MFEQESYNAVTQVESQHGNLFHNYEVKNWVFSSTLYKILAVSAVLNLAVLAFIGQTNLLTLRGCDSPFVGRVCQVLDMAYVGALMFGTEREYVEEAYQNIDLGEAEITYIDVSGEAPPLYYPENYFRLANPVQYAASQQPTADSTNLTNSFGTNIPGFSIPRNNDSDLLSQRATPPTPNPNAFQDDGNTNPFKVDNGTNAGVVRRKPRNRPLPPADDPKKGKKDEDAPVGEVKPDPTPSVNPADAITEKVINKLPFKDLAKKVSERVANEKLNLETPFLVKATGKLNKDGKLEKATFKWIKAESSDPQMIRVVQESVETFNDSGFLQYLSDLNGKTLDLSVQQDDANISAVVQAEMERDTRAQSIATLLQYGVSLEIDRKQKVIAQMELENNPAKAADLSNDKDDLELLKNTKVVADGKKVIINFNVPKGVIQAMIQRKLQEQAAAELKKENGTAELKSGSNTAKN